MNASVDLRAIEAHLGRRLKRHEVDELRDAADRVLARARIESALATARQADPASVSPTWGIA